MARGWHGFCGLVWLLVTITEGRQRTNEEILFEILFRDYDAAVRPVIRSSDTVTVDIQFSLLYIADLDEQRQVLTSSGIIILEWKDERLAWIPADRDNVTKIIVKSPKIWTPDFGLINGAESLVREYPEYSALISYDGNVHWEPAGLFKTACAIDVEYYPFDQQRCMFIFGAWSHDTSMMNLTTRSTSINLDSYEINREWQLVDSSARRTEYAYECCPTEGHANVHFYVNILRRPKYYIINVLLPTIMTSVLLLSIFFCPPAEKIQLGVIVVVSFQVFMFNVSNQVPKTSDQTPLLSIYLGSTMATAIISIILSLFSINMQQITDRPVPDWARTVFFTWLARPLRMGPCHKAGKKDESVELAKKGTECAVEAHGASSAKEDAWAKEWKRLVKIMDRLFFCVVLLAIIIITAIMFGPIKLYHN